MKGASITALFACSLVITLLVYGCGHTNELARHPTAGKTYQSETRVAPDAVSTSVSTWFPTGHPLGDILVAAGSAAASAEAREKLARAVRPEGVAAEISEAFERDAARYLRVTRQDRPGMEWDFLIRTRLEKIELRSHSSGVFLHVDAEISIIDRQTAALVWQYSEAQDVPLRRTGAGPPLQDVAEIFNAVQLLNLPEKEIQDAVLNAAASVGQEIGEILREDVEKLSR